MNLQVNQTEQIEQNNIVENKQELPILAVINDSRVLDFDKDRYYLQGIDFTRYNLNPVLCLNHEYDKLPIGTVNNLEIRDGKLYGNLNFYESDIDSEHVQLCKTVKDMVQKGVIKGISMTTRDIETYPNNYGGVDLIQCELLEISVVTLPNNPKSLVL